MYRGRLLKYHYPRIAPVPGVGKGDSGGTERRTGLCVAFPWEFPELFPGTFPGIIPGVGR